jgi:hypothetical protein
MEIPSIRELADMVMDLVRKNGISTREAIYSIANEYEIDPQQIGKELSYRSRLKRENRRKKNEKEHEDEIARLHDEMVVHDACSHEWEMRRGFKLAGHVDDY